MKYDFQLMVSTLIILLMGIMIHYSIGRDNINYHLIYVCLGLTLGFLASKVDIHLLRGFAKHLYGLGLFLLVITLLLASVTRGSRRWIDLGLFQFQPSEIVKLLMILALPEWISRTSLNNLRALFKIVTLISLPVALVLIQPDLGTAIIIGTICIAMIFVNGLEMKYIVLATALLAVLSPGVWFALKDYQKDRIYTFINPASDPLGKGYNSIQSQIAVGSGQVFGRGLGHGTQSKLRFLPEFQTDFVFASLAEELGLLGGLILLLSYAWLISRLIHLSSRTHSSYQMTVIIGIAIMLMTQTVVNIGMNMGVLPVTGITLPLVSAGGTSIVVTLMALGFAAGIARKQKLIQGIEINGKDK